MKLYHFNGSEHPGLTLGHDTPDVKRFFTESLKDYLTAMGRTAAGFKAGEMPAIRKGEHGKPYFEGSELKDVFFSLSHTENCAAVVFSESEVGLDCENITARNLDEDRYVSIAKRCFTDDEYEYAIGSTKSENLQDFEKTRRFFEIWTAKEAYMKYTGNGFSEGFKTFSVLDPPPGVRFETDHFADLPEIIYTICMAESAYHERALL